MSRRRDHTTDPTIPTMPNGHPNKPYSHRARGKRTATGPAMEPGGAKDAGVKLAEYITREGLCEMGRGTKLCSDPAAARISGHNLCRHHLAILAHLMGKAPSVLYAELGVTDPGPAVATTTQEA